MGLFSFAESPQLQALLADIAPPTIRDASFALYFTLAFGVGSLWTAVYGLIIAAAGETVGLPIVFGLMAASFVAASLAVLPVRAGRWGDRSSGVRPLERLRRRLPGVPPAVCYHAAGPVKRASGRGVAQLGSAYRSGR